MDTQEGNTIPDDVQERWLPVEGFPGYEVSDFGRVRSFWRIVGFGDGGGTKSVLANMPQKIFQTCFDKYGYHRVCLRKNGKRFYRHVHHLVLESFVGPRPSGGVCRHLDGIRANNLPANLIWGTPQENSTDMIAHGTSPIGKRNPSAKLTEFQVTQIREFATQGISRKELAMTFKVSKSLIDKIVNYQVWSHLPG